MHGLVDIHGSKTAQSNGEVTFQDFSSPNKVLKRGFIKITEACRLAIEHGLEFVWIDTCCINKSSSAELTEAINSMFRYYQNAQICFVFLADLPPEVLTEDGLPGCRWFTRGWTLQELLAPQKVEFFDMEWRPRGSKHHYCDIISSSTRIPKDALLGQESIRSYSVATRMSWAARRQTTRVEDIGYCLLGIFDVNMSPIYGEGQKAFRRLQEEIIKHDNDLTIFAWDVPQDDKREFLGLFATSPAVFSVAFIIRPTSNFLSFSYTNKGITITGELSFGLFQMRMSEERRNPQVMGYFLHLGINDFTGQPICIHLRKIGPGYYYRKGNSPLVGCEECKAKPASILENSGYYILSDPTLTDISFSFSFRKNALHVPLDYPFELGKAFPEKLWDCANHVFLRPKPWTWGNLYPMMLAISFTGTFSRTEVPLAVLCDYRNKPPICHFFKRDEYDQYTAMIFQERYRYESISWEDLQLQAPELLLLGNCVKVEVGSQVYKIKVSFGKGIVENITKEAELYSLKFSIS